MNQPAHSRQKPWTGPMVWTGDQLSNNSWIVQLTENELGELHTCVNASKVTEKPIGELTKLDFAFTHLGDRLAGLRKNILNGH